MSTVWREYGVIAVLMAVAIGGYLYVSRNQEDLLALSMSMVGSHLVSLVDDPDEKQRVTESLGRLQGHVAERLIPPERIEAFAASVLNLGAVNTSISEEEADMLLDMAFAPPEGADPASTEPADRQATGRRIHDIVAFFERSRDRMPLDSSGVPMPAMRFYADNGLHAVVDERLRTPAPGPDEAALPASRLEWKGRLAESIQAERGRFESDLARLNLLREQTGDSLLVPADVRRLIRIRRMAAAGISLTPKMDSIRVRMEREVERTVEQLHNSGVELRAAPKVRG